MAIYSIENDYLLVKVKSDGGELTSVIDKKTKMEYIWCGDSKYWGRQAPILFPVVGSMKNKEYTYNGVTYAMRQHGFARDMEFSCEQEDNAIWCTLESTQDTKVRYPFDFRLRLGYVLEGRTVKVIWNVINTGSISLPFSIGGHPAFNCPVDDRKQSEYYIRTNAKKEIFYGEVNESGLLKSGVLNKLEVSEDGSFLIDEHMFDKDALVIEGKQLNRIELLTPDKKAYVTVEFDMPLCGIWSPTKKNAPFVCIEPWCGRCDSDTFDGDIYSRQYGTILESRAEFNKEYTITFD